MNFQGVRTRQALASVTRDGVTCKREGDRIVVVAGPGCQLAASGSFDTVAVAVSSKKDEKH